MILEFSVENFRSFKTKQTISFVAAADRAHPSSVTTCSNIRILKSIGIWGPNASGKSNLTLAFTALHVLAVQSATGWNRGHPIPFVESFALDDAYSSRPSAFSITVVARDGAIYDYSIAATSAQVESESLSVRQRLNGKKTLLFSRQRQRKSSAYFWKFSKQMAAPSKQQLKSQTRDNASALSHGAQLNLHLIAPIYDRLQTVLTYMSHEATAVRIHFAKWIKSEPARVKWMTDLLADADVGIEGLTIRETSGAPHPFEKAIVAAIQESNPNVRDVRTSSLEIMTDHRAFGSDKTVAFNMALQDSRGTQQMFSLAASFIKAMEMGESLVVDEIDCSLHSILSGKLISLFHNTKINVRSSQLLFTTHDVFLMNQNVMRRDQVWFADKRQDGSTSLVSLRDFRAPKGKPRSTERFGKNYMAGHYGAVPRLGATFEGFGVPWPQAGKPADD
jgi:uncharacterized protein